MICYQRRLWKGKKINSIHWLNDRRMDSFASRREMIGSHWIRRRDIDGSGLEIIVGLKWIVTTSARIRRRMFWPANSSSNRHSPDIEYLWSTDTLPVPRTWTEKRRRNVGRLSLEISLQTKFFVDTMDKYPMICLCVRLAGVSAEDRSEDSKWRNNLSWSHSTIRCAFHRTISPSNNLSPGETSIGHTHPIRENYSNGFAISFRTRSDLQRYIGMNCRLSSRMLRITLLNLPTQFVVQRSDFLG